MRLCLIIQPVVNTIYTYSPKSVLPCANSTLALQGYHYQLPPGSSLFRVEQRRPSRVTPRSSTTCAPNHHKTPSFFSLGRFGRTNWRRNCTLLCQTFSERKIFYSGRQAVRTSTSLRFSLPICCILVSTQDDIMLSSTLETYGMAT
jgi:hypothetical protein